MFGVGKVVKERGWAGVWVCGKVCGQAWLGPGAIGGGGVAIGRDFISELGWQCRRWCSRETVGGQGTPQFDQRKRLWPGFEHRRDDRFEMPRGSSTPAWTPELDGFCRGRGRPR